MIDIAALPALLAEPRLTRLLALLDEDGEQARVVGGAVRDALLGLPLGEIDLATTALPETVMQRARRAGLHVVPTGLAHGTVTVRVDGTPFEVTTLRRDIDTDGRHAIVAFGRDFDADARRRDFTINALSLDQGGTLHDPLGALPDLQARRVRFIGDARTRIREDYLRILRLFRFHAAYGEGPLDAGARDAAIAERAGLARLSAERINVEMSKLLLARRGADVATEMADAGLLDLLIGGVGHSARLARLVAIDPASDAVTRLAALAVVVAEDVIRLRTRLRLSNAATKRLDELAASLEKQRGVRLGTADIDTLLFRANSRASVMDAVALLHAQASAEVDDAHWRGLRDRAQTASVPHLPITGDELLHRGVAPGPGVGMALKALQARWIRAGFPRDPAVLGALVDAVVGDTPARG